MSYFGLADVILTPINTISGASNIAWLFPGTTVNFQANAQVSEARRRSRGGILVTDSQEVTAESYSVALETEVLDWHTQQLLNNQLSEDETATLEFPVYDEVPVGLVVTDAAITAANLERITLSVTDPVEGARVGYREVITSGSPAEGQVKIDTAAHTFTFHSSDYDSSTGRGSAFVWVKPTVYTSVASLGVTTNARTIGAMKMYLRCLSQAYYPTGVWYEFPKMTRTRNVPNANFGQAPVVQSLEFAPQIQAGNPLPYRMYNLQSDYVTV